MGVADGVAVAVTVGVRVTVGVAVGVGAGTEHAASAVSSTYIADNLPLPSL